ncbi:MAG: ABC transporter permease subunit [Planctomycetales bacterium]|nr:ABC transporter permease subunit [Planctomycetales bacterium]
MSTLTHPPATEASTTTTPPALAPQPVQLTTAREINPRVLAAWSRFKYAGLRFADVTGLSFLPPILRLLDGEETAKQWREIVRTLFVPAAAFALFLFAWTVVAPHHRTKSGVVPTPSAVWDAAQSIWAFHEREGKKESAYLMSGDERSTWLTAARERLTKLEPYEQAASRAVAEATVANQQSVESKIAPLVAQRKELEESIASAQQARLAAMETQQAALPSASVETKEAFLAAVRAHQEATEAERLELQQLDAKIQTARDRVDARLNGAKRTQTAIAEERQYLATLVDQLDGANQESKLDREISQLRNNQRDFLASAGSDILPAAMRVVQSERRINAVRESNYAKPWTLPMQIARSVACVFFGFAIGSLIAIPVGVLCGLSPTFMSAMTPFIALFKPVSPIVWLPIALIIVGGFIPDPNNNGMLSFLEALPLIGWMKINPAFIASAVTVALCSLWATLVNTALGVASVDKDYLNVARVLQLNFRDRLFKIIIPSALPLIFTGLRISLGVGWMVLIAGELLSSSEGIGKFVWDQFNNGASDSFAKMIVVVFIVGVIGLILDRLMVICQRLVSFDNSGLQV